MNRDTLALLLIVVGVLTFSIGAALIGGIALGLLSIGLNAIIFGYVLGQSPTEEAE